MSDFTFHKFLIKYAEIGVKGKNRHLFESALMQQIKYALKKTEGSFSVSREQGRIFVDAESDYDYDGLIENLQRVFGISGICPVVQAPIGPIEQLCGYVTDFLAQVYERHDQTFKVQTRRPKKDYPMDSMEVNREIGGAVLDAFPEMKVDVHKPEILISVELREQVYIYSHVIPGPGGMPVGTNGKGMLLLSGGIDSPVAGWMVAKRGVKLDAVYFHAPPYTSDRAKEKVVELARLVSRYTGPIYLHVVNFTDIQLAIYEKCPHDELTIIMRRYMMRIAEHFARETECLGLITGESIGQVASQTMHSLAVTNEVCTMPVFRPLIGMDKQEIIDLSEKIGTYETSILPYEDCCTIFVAKHPVTKPNLNIIKHSETKLDGVIDDLMKAAVESTEVIIVSDTK